MALNVVYYIPKQSPFPDIILLCKLKHEISEAGSASILWCGEGAHLWATWKELFSFSRNWWQKKGQHPEMLHFSRKPTMDKAKKEIVSEYNKGSSKPKSTDFTKDLGGLRN
jgi:hypothetical protein